MKTEATKRRTIHSPKFFVFCFLGLTLMLAGPMQAAYIYWNVDADGDWTTAGDWLSGSVPVRWSDTAMFTKTLTADRLISNVQNVDAILFGNPSAYNYTLTNNTTLDMSASGIQTLAGNGDHVDTILFTPNFNMYTAYITANATSPNSLLRLRDVRLAYGVSPGTTLVLGGSNTGTNTIYGVISQLAGSRITKADAGTWVLTGVSTFTDGVTVNGGLLTLDAGAGGSIPVNSTLAFGGNGKFNYDNSTAAGSKSLSLGALTNSAGDGTVQITRTAAQTVTLTFSSLYSRPAGVARNFFYGGTPGTIGTDSRIVITAAPTVGVLIDQGTFCNGDYAAYDSGNFMRAMNYTTDNSSGGASVGSAFATFTAAGANGKFVDLGTAGSITAAGTESINTLRIGSNSTANTVIIGGGNTLTIANGGILKAGGSASTISGGTAIAPSVELVIRTDTGSDSLTISTPITGANSLVKCGAGTLTLSGANGYTGQTYLNNGTTIIGANSALGDVATGAQLNLNNATLQTTATMTLDNGGANKRNVVLVNNDNVFAIGANDLTISGAVSGSGGFSKTGSGTMTLSQNVNCSGLIKVNQGTLVVQQMNSSASASVASGATLVEYGSYPYGNRYVVAGTLVCSNKVQFGDGDSLVLNNGTVTGGGGNAGSGSISTMDYVSPSPIFTIIANGSANTINTTYGLSLRGEGILYTPQATDTLSISCGIINNGPLLKTGLGTATLSGTSTYGNTTTISGGTLALGAGGSLSNTTSISIAAGTTFDVSAIANFAFSSANSLSANGMGTSASAAATIKGGTTVNLGSQPITLTIVPTSAADTTHPALLVSQGALTLSNNTFTVTNNSGSLLSVGTYRLIQVGDGTSGTVNEAATPVYPVSVVLPGGASGLVAGSIAIISVSSGNLVLTVAQPSVASYSWVNVAGGNWSVAGNWLDNLGANTAPAAGGYNYYGLSFNQAGTYTANNDLAGTLLLNQLNFGGPTVTLSGNGLGFINNNLTAATLNQNGSSSVTVSNNLVLNSSLTLGGSGSGAVTLAGVISGAFNLTKTNSGTLTLSTNNTFTGQTYLNGGITVISTNSALGDVAAAATNNLNNATLQITANVTLDNAGANKRPVVLTTTNNIFALGANNLTISGVISGSGGFTKTGAGTMTLSGANTYSGATTVNQGNLVISGGSSASPAFYVAGGASLTSSVVMASKTWTIGGNAFLSSQLDQFINGVTLNNGTMTVPGGSGSAWGDMYINASATITANGAANTFGLAGNYLAMSSALTLNAPLATDALSVPLKLGSSSVLGGSLVKTGLGTVTLSGVSIYTGPTTISAGTLVIDGSGNLGSGTYAAVITNNGTLLYSSTAGQTFSGVISGSGALIKTNAGTLILSGTNTYSGSTTVNGGTLNIASNGAITGSTNIMVSAGATMVISNTTDVINNTTPVYLDGMMNLAAGVNETIGTLFILGAGQASGTWGSSTSSAVYKNDTYFSGLGVLNVSVGTAVGDGSWNVDSNGAWRVLANWTNQVMAYGVNQTAYFTNAITASLIVTNDYPLLPLGNLVFGSPGAFSWAVTNNAILLTNAATSTITVNNNIATVYSGVTVSSPGFVKAGAGTLMLSGTANNSFTNLTVSAGTLVMNKGMNTLSGTLTIDGSSAQQLIVTNGVALTSAGGTINGTSGSNTVYLSDAGSVWNAGLQAVNIGLAASAVSNMLIVANGAVLTNALNITISSTLGLNQLIVTNGGKVFTTADIALSGASNTMTFTGAGSIWNPGNSNITVSGTGNVLNVWSGASLTNMAGGTLALGGLDSVFNLSGDAYIKAVNLSVADARMNLANGGILHAAANGNLVYGTGTNYFSGAGGAIDTAGYVVTNAVVNTGSGGLTKSGAGTLTLTNVNVHTGPMTISAGTLEIGGTGQLGAGTYAGAITNNAVLLCNSTAGQTLSGIISGNGTLVKTNSGVLTLAGAGANTYGGLTTVGAGELDLNKTDGVDAIASNLTVYAGTVKWLASNQIKDTATVTLNGGMLNMQTYTDAVSALYFGTDIQIPGTWGSSTSGATFTNDTYFSGNGKLYVGIGAPAPVVSNDGGATNLAPGSSRLWGTLTNSPADVRIYWGASDGDTNSANWANTNMVAWVMTNGFFSATVSNIYYGVIYYYRCYASNINGSAWAPATTNFVTTLGTGLGGGGSSLQISFTNYNRTEALTNFPALVALSNGMAGGSFSFGTFLTTNGYDLRFWTNSTLTGANLNYEIENWSTGSSAYVWVQVPTFTNNCSIWASWGDSSQTNQPAYATNGATWSAGYSNVWHFKETSGVVGDSTTNRNNITLTGTTTRDGTGLINGSCRFDGTNGYGYSSTPSIAGPNTFTISTFFKTTTGAGGKLLGFGENQTGSSGSYDRHLYMNNAGNIYVGVYPNAVKTLNSTAALNDGQWHYAAACLSSAGFALVIDGVLQGSDATVTSGQAYNGYWRVGYDNLNGWTSLPSSYYFNGWLDEARYSGVVRSTNWLWAEFMNQASNSTFNTVQPVASFIKNNYAANVINTAADLTATLSASGAVYRAIAYWGTADGMTNGAGLWQYTNSVGWYTNQTFVLTNNVTGLLSNTLYYYTFQVTNSFTNIWAIPSASFTTPGPPTVATAAPTNIGIGYATLAGNMVSTGLVPTTVHTYWGDSNGGANKSSWGNVYTNGVLPVGSFSNTVSNLFYGLTYYYRCYATNVYGDAWAPTTTNFTTLPSSGMVVLPTGVVVWVKADAVDTNDTVNEVRISGSDIYVKQWDDQSGFGHNATNATASAQPTYIANALNGKPVLRFIEANSSKLYFGDLSDHFPIAASLFAVATINSDGRYNLFGNRTGTDERWVANTWTESHPGSFRITRASGTFAYLKWPQTGSHVFSLESSASVYRTLTNGVQNGSDTASFHSGAGVSWNIADSADGNVQTLNGDIPEMILYNRVLSSSEADIVGGYLATKYGLLTTAYPPASLFSVLGLTNKTAVVQSSTSAVLNATLACTGAVYNVYAYWNTVNGGTNVSTWTNSAYFGIWTNFAYVGSWTNLATTNISWLAGGLAPATTYYFTFRGSNACEVMWATNVMSFTTSNALPGGVLVEIDAQPSTNSTLPFIEEFESYTNNTQLDGTNGWRAVFLHPLAVASAQSGVKFGGTMAGKSAYSYDWHGITATDTNVWVDYYVYPELRAVDSMPVNNENSSAAWFINKNGQVVALSNATWVPFATPVVAAGQWCRFTVNMDYANKLWAIYVANGVSNALSTKVAGNLAFANTSHSSIRSWQISSLLDSMAYFDSLSVMSSTNGPPLCIDSDGDGMPDAWETANGFNPADPSDGTSDFDGDGVNNRNEYIAGTDPRDSLSYMRVSSFDLASSASSDITLTILGGDKNVSSPYPGDAVGRTYTVIAESNVWTGVKTPAAGLTGLGIGLTGTNVYTDVNAVNLYTNRFYQVAVSLGALSYTNSTEWAMYVQARQTNRKYFVCVPVDYSSTGSNNLNSTVGQQLARGLYANNASLVTSDKIWWFTSTNGYEITNWWLKTNSTSYSWVDLSGAVTADVPVYAGMPFWIERGANAGGRSNAVFTGRTFTNGSAVSFTFTTNIATMFGWPLPKSRWALSTITNAFGFETIGSSGTEGYPAMFQKNLADQIWTWNNNTWFPYYWLIRSSGTDNGKWWNEPQSRYATFALEPGRAYYYMHVTNQWGGTNFVWTPQNAP